MVARDPASKALTPASIRLNSTHSNENSEKDGLESAGSSFSLSFITIAFVIMAGVGVFGLNFWHSTHCHEAHTSDEIDTMYKSLMNRVLETESAAWASSLELEKFVTALAEELANVEDKEMHKLKALAHAGNAAHHRKGAAGAEAGGTSVFALHPSEEALAKVQLALANTPSPLKHRFHLEKRLAQDAEALADQIAAIMTSVSTDELTGKVRTSEASRASRVERFSKLEDAGAEEFLTGPDKAKERDSSSVDRGAGDAVDAIIPSESVATPPSQTEVARKKLQDDDFLYIPDPLVARANNVPNRGMLSSHRGSAGVWGEGSSSAGDAASAATTCAAWKKKYDVHIGVSWGSLPYDLQERWLKINCDHVLPDAGAMGKDGVDAGGAAAGQEQEQDIASSEVLRSAGNVGESGGDGDGNAAGGSVARRRRRRLATVTTPAPSAALRGDDDRDGGNDDDEGEYQDDDDTLVKPEKEEKEGRGGDELRRRLAAVTPSTSSAAPRTRGADDDDSDDNYLAQDDDIAEAAAEADQEPDDDEMILAEMEDEKGAPAASATASASEELRRRLQTPSTQIDDDDDMGGSGGDDDSQQLDAHGHRDNDDDDMIIAEMGEEDDDNATAAVGARDQRREKGSHGNAERHQQAPQGQRRDASDELRRRLSPLQ